MNENATPLDQIISLRKDKLAKLQEAGLPPYPPRCTVDGALKTVQERFAALPVGGSTEDHLSVAGRLISRRDMGKASFADIADISGKLQLYFKADILGADPFRFFKDLVDLSDFIGVEGTPFRTRTGELSLKVERWTMLSKALRPLPEKWHGLKDTETRYRQRYLDLLANTEVRETFVKRSAIISTIRKELEQRAFLEVETPMMQVLPGGATARPFVTHHNAMDMKLSMRIAPELYLKRLVVGGLDRVFEIGRNFRNEGIDRNHNPEFTMMELYQAYADYNEMMTLTEQLISAAAKTIGTDIEVPFRRVGFFDILKEKTGIDFLSILGTGKAAAAARAMNIDLPDSMTEKKVLDHIFDEKVVPTLTSPTFVMDYPSAYSPLAKPKPENPGLAERFELYINGMEIANAYSELNDPLIQKKNFEAQMEEKRQGDDEAQPYDDDFITALEHGLPPTGGLGIGIDRLVMILTKTDSIREVILFPLMRPE